MPSQNPLISADHNNMNRRAPTLNLFPHGASDDDEDERLRRYYDTRPCSPIATGVLIKSYNVNGKSISYYDFFGLGAPDEETADRPISKRCLTKAWRSAAVDQPTAENGLINNMMVAVVEEDALANQNEDMEEGEFVPDGNVEINYTAEQGPGAEGDVWKLRKVLTKSDVNTSSRLLLFGDQVRSHVFKYINESEVTVDGKQVRVWDADVQDEHTLRLAKWTSSGCYVFKDGWKARIVDGRKLKKGDEVGFYWDHVYSRFIFSVLKVAPELEVAAEPEQAAA